MILEKETLEEFGYRPDDLGKHSQKKIVVRCDYCGTLAQVTKKNRLKSTQYVDKDACKKCKFKKREEVSLARDGVSNSAQRIDVREKLKQKTTFGTKEFQEKRDKTMMERYGTTNAMYNKDLKEKHTQVFRDKYGVENPSQIKSVQEKKKQTNLEKYGSEQFFNSEAGKQAKIEGMRKKYGVDNAFQSEEIKEKIKQNNLDTLGVEHHLQTTESMEKQKKTNMEKYGYENVAQVDEHKESIRKTNLEKYGYEYATQSEEVKNKTRQTLIDQGKIKIFNEKDMATLAEEKGIPYSTFTLHVRKHGFEEALKMMPKISSLEMIMKNWFNEEGWEYIHQFRVENRIADFLLHDLIIECDGLFWHSDAVIKDNNYHVNKRDLYIKHNYRPFFFRQDEIENKFPIIQSMIRNALAKSKQVYARNCTVKEVDKAEAKEFFTTNHLMGPGIGFTLGLYTDKLICAMQTKRVKHREYEISRFCSLLNYGVVGGFSRLLKHFEQNFKPSLTQTFIDQRYGSGNYLQRIGFTRTSCYKSFKWSNGEEVFHRMLFPGNSGYDYGLVKLWDCGQAKYVK
jgi:hypothetical protein